MVSNDRLTPAEIAAYIDHTCLKPDATRKVISAVCEDAVRYGFFSVCVNGMRVPLCRELLQGSPVRISAVCGFPLGAMSAAAMGREAAQAVEDGAAEIDMVLPVGALLDGDLATVERHISTVVRATEGRAIVKVIMETGYLSDEQKEAACRVSAAAGAHYVKTSTGFGPGGATEEDIRLMRRSVPAHIGVKASGGVRDCTTAIRMIEAGATRIGTSSGVAIVLGATGQGDY